MSNPSSALSANRGTARCAALQCGSCWAFAGVAAAESRVLIALNKTNATYSIDTSEQQIVDCASGKPNYPYSYGCSGGQIQDPLKYAAK